MTSHLDPYSKYKNSGVPWLGDVPDHWQVLKARNIVKMLVSNVDKISKDEEIPIRLCNYIDVYKNDRITAKLPFMAATAQKEEINQFHLQLDDVLITKDSESWTDIGVPSLVQYTAPDLICGYHLAILRPLKYIALGNYLLYALKSRGVASQFHISANGVTRYGLSHSDIKNIRFPIPPLPEQTAIVRFLDHADRRIKRYIRAKQKLIKLLNEQKQAIIQQAVTRGLDSNVRLKASGVDWLGNVPEHWEVRALKTHYSVNLGKMLDAKQITGNFLVPYLRNIDVQWDRINTNNLPVMDIHDGEYDRYSLKSGDLLVCEGGDVGRAAFWNGSLQVCGFQKALHRLRPISDKVDFPRYIYYALFLASKLGVFIADGSENTIAHLTKEKLQGHYFPFPSRIEQERISNFLDMKIANIDQLIESIHLQIAFIQEYRTRLIADVVTGKLDVRAAAAKLPEEFEDLEPAEEEELLPEDLDDPSDLEAVPEEEDA